MSPWPAQPDQSPRSRSGAPLWSQSRGCRTAVGAGALQIYTHVKAPPSDPSITPEALTAGGPARTAHAAQPNACGATLSVWPPGCACGDTRARYERHLAISAQPRIPRSRRGVSLFPSGGEISQRPRRRSAMASAAQPRIRVRVRVYAQLLRFTHATRRIAIDR